jgi:hypothetical protein
LLVAARVPDGFQTETVAAFMPQILGRMSQYASELQPGKMGSLGFVIDRTPWQFFKAGDLLLGVVGRDGGVLPMPELMLVAAELTARSRAS